jgi:hypothetical protein
MYAVVWMSLPQRLISKALLSMRGSNGRCCESLRGEALGDVLLPLRVDLKGGLWDLIVSQ